MLEISSRRRFRPSLSSALILCGFIGTGVALIWIPSETRAALLFVATSLIEVAPLVIPGIALAAWVGASGAGAHVATAFSGRIGRAVLAASAVGAVTPVCGVTVLPLMAGLLAAGVPLAPVMAFWLSSPITDPAMLAATAATLGVDFALGKTAAAFGMGALGGFVTAALGGRSRSGDPLRRNLVVGRLGREVCGGGPSFNPAIWSSMERRAEFLREAWATTRLILICLIPAFAAEHALKAVFAPDALAAYLGAEAWAAVPLAVLVGAPAYFDGYAALPLTRALIDHGMSRGAAMAFLVSGGVVSVWGAMAILPVLRLKPFLLYLGLAIAGSLASGWIFGLVA